MNLTGTVRSPYRRLTARLAENESLMTLGRVACGVGRAVLAAVGSSPDDIRVWSRPIGPGEQVFYAYDPRTGDRFSSPSEDELRAWLENRHRYRF